MRFCIFTRTRSQRSHQNTFLKKAKTMQMLQVLHSPIMKPYKTYPHPQWSKAISLQRVREFIQPSTTSEKPPLHPLRRKIIQVPTMQLLKCSIQWTKKTHDQAFNKWLVLSYDMVRTNFFTIECLSLFMNHGAHTLFRNHKGRCFDVLCLCIAESAILLSNPGPIIALPVCAWYAWCFWRL